jgi:hypothetical protein
MIKKTRFSEIWFTDVCRELYDNSLNGTIPTTLGNLSKMAEEKMHLIATQRELCYPTCQAKI